MAESDRTAEDLHAAAMALVAALRGVEVRARRAMDGRIGGQQRGLRRGGGVEFSAHRDYAPGDDLRRLDWRAFARNDRLYIKQFEQEVHAAVTILVDGSASMALQDDVDGSNIDKWAQVQVLAATIALLVSRQGDAVALRTSAEPDRAVAPAAGAAQIARILATLAALRPQGRAGLEGLDGPGGPAWHGAGQSGVVIALSDVLSEPVAAIAPLARLRRAGHDVLLFHTLHPLELRFEFGDAVELHCAETDLRLRVEPRAVRQRYLAMMTAHCEAVRERCIDAGIRYALIDLGEPLVASLRRAISGLATGGR